MGNCAYIRDNTVYSSMAYTPENTVFSLTVSLISQETEDVWMSTQGLYPCTVNIQIFGSYLISAIFGTDPKRLN